MNLYRLKVGLYDAKCQALRLLRIGSNMIQRPAAEHHFLFILCAPYSGSTLLHELVSTSSAVSANNIFGTREGMSLPDVRQLVDYREEWNSAYAYPWPQIKERWLQYWDHSKPILLDKSPAAILRAEAIEQHFKPISFLALVRHPYAHVESLMRRNKLSLDEALQFSIQLLKAQHDNLKSRQRVLLVRYEDLVNKPAATCAAIEAFLPGLGPLEHSQKFKAHNQTGEPQVLRNFNSISLKRLAPDQLQKMKDQLQEHQDILSNFGYSLDAI